MPVEDGGELAPVPGQRASQSPFYRSLRKRIDIATDFNRRVQRREARCRQRQKAQAALAPDEQAAADRSGQHCILAQRLLSRLKGRSRGSSSPGEKKRSRSVFRTARRIPSSSITRYGHRPQTQMDQVPVAWPVCFMILNRPVSSVHAKTRRQR
jgi:hypothetical protein